VLDEHDRIVNGIRVGDPESAAIAMCYHLDQARSRLLDGQLDR
jgi:DNA-binding FadR family transcriptional regulator